MPACLPPPPLALPGSQTSRSVEGSYIRSRSVWQSAPLITTAKLANVDAFRYLTAVLKHRERVAQAPDDWLPWTWEDTLRRLALDRPGA